MNNTQDVPHWAHAVGGGLGSLIGAVLTSPLEVVKTRLQAQYHKGTLQKKAFFGLGTLNAVAVLFKEEGFRGLYRGLGAHITGVVPSRAVQLLVYGNTKNYLEKNIKSEYFNLIPAISSGFAGAVVVTLTQPIWFMKTRLQLQTIQSTATIYNGMWDCFTKTVKQEGVRGLYKGLGASYLGLFETIIQFSLYERSKLAFTDANSSGSLIFFLSAFSKLVASALTYPHEVIRTRLREERSSGPNAKYKGPFQGLWVLGKEEGLRGLYSGLGPHLIRVVPNAAILLFVYETSLWAFASFFQGSQHTKPTK